MSASPLGPSPDATLAWYAHHAARFVAHTAARDLGDARARFLAHLRPGATVLDAGCGAGRDTRAFQAAGCQVTPMEPVEPLARATEVLTGLRVQRRRHEAVDDVAAWDGVWALASLLHLPRAVLPDVLARYARALRPGGVLYASFKEGARALDGPDPRDAEAGRWFSFYTVDDLNGLVHATPGLQLLDVARDAGRSPEGDARAWLTLLVRRAP